MIDQMPTDSQHDVYILGAGFSVPFGLPDGNGLFSNFYDEISGTQKSSLDMELETRGYDCHKPLFYYENFLSDLDSDIEFCESLCDGLSGYYSQRLDELLKIRRYIRAELFNKLRFFEDKFRKKNDCNFPHVDSLIEHAQRTEGLILSFNYDTCLEWILSQRKIAISNLGQKTPQAPRIMIRKLHGSLNWLSSSWDCEFLTYSETSDVKIVDIKHSPQVIDTQVGDDKDVVLIYPSLFKSLSNASNYLKQQWNRAIHDLTFCKNIHFIGYSLPDGDRLTNFILNHSRSPRMDRKIFVYDIAFKNMNSSTALNLKSRYNKIYEKHHEISFVASDFKKGITIHD